MLTRVKSTYAWITDTPSSRRFINRMGIILATLGLIDIIKDTRMERSRCPAVMLAISRIDRVIGRIMILIVSIRTMNGIKAGGVPWGSKDLAVDIGDLVKLNSKGRAHKDSLIGRIIEMCELVGKISGSRELKLFVRIKAKVDDRKKKITVFLTKVCFSSLYVE